MIRQIFVNLPIRDMQRTQAFFKALGLSFDPRFTNDQGACLQIAPNIYAMLLVEPFFQGFTKLPVADARECTEVLIALSCDSRAEVDERVAQAVAAGEHHAECAGGPRLHVPAWLCRPGRPPMGGVLDGRERRAAAALADALGGSRGHCCRLAHRIGAHRRGGGAFGARHRSGRGVGPGRAGLGTGALAVAGPARQPRRLADHRCQAPRAGPPAPPAHGRGAP